MEQIQHRYPGQQCRRLEDLGSMSRYFTIRPSSEFGDSGVDQGNLGALRIVRVPRGEWPAADRAVSVRNSLHRLTPSIKVSGNGVACQVSLSLPGIVGADHKHDHPGRMSASSPWRTAGCGRRWIQIGGMTRRVILVPRRIRTPVPPEIARNRISMPPAVLPAQIPHGGQPIWVRAARDRVPAPLAAAALGLVPVRSMPGRQPRP